MHACKRWLAIGLMHNTTLTIVLFQIYISKKFKKQSYVQARVRNFKLEMRGTHLILR